MVFLDWKILSDGIATNFLSRLSKRETGAQITRFCCGSKTQNEGSKTAAAGIPGDEGE